MITAHQARAILAKAFWIDRKEQAEFYFEARRLAPPTKELTPYGKFCQVRLRQATAQLEAIEEILK